MNSSWHGTKTNNGTSTKEKAPPSKAEDGAPLLEDGRLVAPRAAGLPSGGGIGLLLHGDYRGGFSRHANREDVIGCLDPAEEVLISDVLEAEGWFVFDRRGHLTRSQQYRCMIINTSDLELRGVAIVYAIDSVGARGKRFSGHHKIVGNLHKQLIDFLGPAGRSQCSQSSQRKKCGQKSSVGRFHHSPFVVWGVVGGITAALGVAPQGLDQQSSNNHPQNVYALFDAIGFRPVMGWRVNGV